MQCEKRKMIFKFIRNMSNVLLPFRVCVDCARVCRWLLQCQSSKQSRQLFTVSPTIFFVFAMRFCLSFWIRQRQCKIWPQNTWRKCEIAKKEACNRNAIISLVALLALNHMDAVQRQRNKIIRSITWGSYFAFTRRHYFFFSVVVWLLFAFTSNWHSMASWIEFPFTFSCSLLSLAQCRCVLRCVEYVCDKSSPLFPFMCDQKQFS